MAAHRADDLFFVTGVRFAGRLFAQKNGPDDLIADDERHKKLYPAAFKTVVIDLKERQHLGVFGLDRVEAVGQKLAFVLETQREAERKIVAQAANREHVQFVAVTRITRDAAPHYRQRTRYQVQRGPDRLLKVVLIGNFLPEVRQRPKRVYQLCSLFDHLGRGSWIVVRRS